MATTVPAGRVPLVTVRYVKWFLVAKTKERRGWSFCFYDKLNAFHWSFPSLFDFCSVEEPRHVILWQPSLAFLSFSLFLLSFFFNEWIVLDMLRLLLFYTHK